MLKRVLALAFLGSGLALNIPPASAAAVGLSTLTDPVAVGDLFQVDLDISGLGDGASPSLGAFAIEVTYDDTLLDFESASFGAFLGDPDPFAFETATFVDDSVAGEVYLEETSFLFGFELDALQPDSFNLASLFFRGLAPGSSALGFGTIDLADAQSFTAGSLAVDGTTTDDVTVVPPTAVPLPGTAWLLAPLALLALGRRPV